MTYPEQLLTPEWKKKRQKILERDKFSCQNCFNAEIVAQAKKGIWNKGKFYVESDGIDYINILSDPDFPRANGNIIYYGILKATRIYLVGARNKTLLEIEYDKLGKELNQLLSDNKSVIVDSEFSIKSQQLEDLKKKIAAEDPIGFEWIAFQGLHIHHKYYIMDKTAWEYEDHALITLCAVCHDKLHENQTIPVFNNEMDVLTDYHYCLRCHGKGVFPKFTHVEAGICFRCNGARYEELIFG